MHYYARIPGDEAAEMTQDEIKAAFEAGRCLLAHSYGIDRTNTCLEIDGVERDTRNEVQSMHEAVWTRRPESLEQCLQAAR